MPEPSRKLYPTTQYLAGDFVIAAGSVLFRKTSEGTLEICLLYDRQTEEWLLPKGRKDRGESIEAAAVRETFEETGYPCELLPVRMPTRAPAIGVNGPDVVEFASEGITEPIAVTMRDMRAGGRGMKCMWWYITKATGGERVHGTQTEWETFDSNWVDANSAPDRLSFEDDQEVARKAVELVKADEMSLLYRTDPIGPPSVPSHSIVGTRAGPIGLNPGTTLKTETAMPCRSEAPKKGKGSREREKRDSVSM